MFKRRKKTVKEANVIDENTSFQPEQDNKENISENTNDFVLVQETDEKINPSQHDTQLDTHYSQEREVVPNNEIISLEEKELDIDKTSLKSDLVDSMTEDASIHEQTHEANLEENLQQNFLENDTQDIHNENDENLENGDSSHSDVNDENDEKTDITDITESIETIVPTTVTQSKTKKAKKIAVPEEAGIAQKTFKALSYIALPSLIILTIALCCQQFFFPRDFWFSEEVRFADVYMNMFASQNFFHLTLNGLPFAEVGPLYFLSIFAIDKIPGVDMPQAFFIASALFAVLYIGATWLFARAIGLGKQGAFVAGLIALSTFFFIGLSHYNRMDLLHAALLNLSFLFFYYGWKKKNGFFSLTFAFIFLALSVLINGVLYIIIPFIAGFFFLIWAGRLRRITGGDGLLGFFLFLLIVFGWYGLLYYYGEASYISELFKIQVLEPFALTAYTAPLWYYLPALALISLPWIFLLFFADWFQNLKKIPQYFKTRKENASVAWLLCLTVSILLLLTFTHNKECVNLVALLPVFSLLLAKILISLSPLRSKIFFMFLTFIFFILAILFIVFEFHELILSYAPQLWIFPQEIPTYITVATANTTYGMAMMGGLFILTAIILGYFTRKTQAGGALFVTTLFLIISAQPFSLFIAPKLDLLLSPKTQANILAEYAEQGYAPASFGVASDVYTYYYNVAFATDNLSEDIVENTSKNNGIYPQKSIKILYSIEELEEFVCTNPLVVLAISAEKFNQLPDTQYVKEVQKQWLETKEIAITLWNAPQKETLLEEAPLLPDQTTGETTTEEIVHESIKEAVEDEITPDQVMEVPTEITEASEKVVTEDIADDIIPEKEIIEDMTEAGEKVVTEDMTDDIIPEKEIIEDMTDDITPENVNPEEIGTEDLQTDAVVIEEIETNSIEVNPEDTFLFEKKTDTTPSL